MSDKTLVILQSNYIPWKGYFDLMAIADEFLLFDEVQFTKNDWRNRNRIVLAGRLHWLTIPIRTAGQFGMAIERAEVSGRDWARAHWETLQQAYRRAPHFTFVAPALDEAYQAAGKLDRLTEINELFLRVLAALLGVQTPILHAAIVPRQTDDPTQRLLEVCRARKATAYVSGPAARAYLDPTAFERAGIKLYYANYAGYPLYGQNCEPFHHGVSVVDMLMQCGPQARSHLKAVASPLLLLTSTDRVQLA
jgi:hypothetical protein